jgi:hypothetical protein
MELVKPTLIPNPIAALERARVLTRSAEAIRLNWNRGSLRIVRDAQDRVALERPRIVRPGR